MINYDDKIHSTLAQERGQEEQEDSLSEQHGFIDHGPDQQPLGIIKISLTSRSTTKHHPHPRRPEDPNQHQIIEIELIGSRTTTGHYHLSIYDFRRLMKNIQAHRITLQLIIITIILSICLLIYSIPSPHPQAYYSSPSTIFSASSDLSQSTTTTTTTSTTHTTNTNTAPHIVEPDYEHDSPQVWNEDEDHLSLESRILNAAPILGFYEQSNHGTLSNWMAALPDQLPMTRLSIPGTHDSATWNYTQASQDRLEPVTGKLPPAIAYQCQDRSLFQMLGDGIRFFDLRVGFLPNHRQLGFFHASAILSQTTTLDDVLLGFYKWLDDHPTETVLVSIKVDNATFGDPPSTGQPSSRKLQQIIYQLLTQSELAQKHWLQEDSVLGTLGGARGKLIFIQRIDWQEIRSDDRLRPIGIGLPPQKFNDNDASFQIEYNEALGSKAFIEDFYELLPDPSSVQTKVELKLEAVDRHLQLASDDLNPETRSQLFLTFASGGALRNLPPVTPKMLAIGTGYGTSLENAVNARIKRLIVEGRYNANQDDGDSKRARLGILILDWYFQVPDLIQSIVDQNHRLLSSSEIPAPQEN